MDFKAVAFDVDGVITDIESIWRFIHQELNTLKIAEKNAKLYYSGKITYEEWALLDAGLWKGVSYEKMANIVRKIPLKDGLKELTSFLKARGLRIFAISAGLDLLREPLYREAFFDEFLANKLIIKNGKVTGEVEVHVTVENKGEILEKLCLKYGFSPIHVIAVGDSEVDIPMFRKAGLSIAFNPNKLEVAKEADVTLYGDLIKLLAFFRKIL